MVNCSIRATLAFHITGRLFDDALLFHSSTLSMCSPRDSRFAVCRLPLHGSVQHLVRHLGCVRHVGAERLERLRQPRHALLEGRVVAAGVGREHALVILDPSRDEWATKTLPLINSFTLGFSEKAMPFSRRTLSDWRSGKRRPHRKRLPVLERILREISEE